MISNSDIVSGLLGVLEAQNDAHTIQIVMIRRVAYTDGVFGAGVADVF